ncbi:ABC transporter substrate-binding protein [Arthrobacter sp. MN05-02]|nr:ABC transporter substrate-binding protein [Arthrobacter sp. MN05-02]
MGHDPTPRTPVSRRSILQGLLGAGGLLAAGGTLAGCSTSAAGRGGVQLWDLFSGADGAKMRSMIQSVTTAAPDLSVRPVTLAWGSPYYTKLAMSSASGKAPETAIMHVSRLAGYAPGGLLEPFDLDLLAEQGITEQDFAPAVWQSCQYEGRLYALPLDTHPFIAFYNRDIADEAGLLTADGTLQPITSPDAMIDTATRLAAVTGAQGISFGHVLDTGQSWRLFWGLYAQTGGDYSMTVGSPASIDRDKAREVIEFLVRLMDGTAMADNLNYPGAISAFTSGRTGMILSGEWELPAFAESIPNLGAMPMPTLFGTPATYADSHAWVLPRQADQDPETRRRTYELVAGILKQGGTWAAAGHIPAYLPVQDTPEYTQLSPQTEYASAGENPVFDPSVWFAGAGTEFQKQVSEALSGAFTGALSPDEAIDSMLSRIDAMLLAPNPT